MQHPVVHTKGPTPPNVGGGLIQHRYDHMFMKVKTMHACTSMHSRDLPELINLPPGTRMAELVRRKAVSIQ